jgi:hypothetical protein
MVVARRLTVLCWHLLTKGVDYLWARPALVANKTRAMQLQAGHPQQKGSRRGPAYAYNIKSLRDREMLIAAQPEQSYERFVSQWKPRRPKTGARAPQLYSRQCMRLYWHPTLSGSRRRHRRSSGNAALLLWHCLKNARSSGGDRTASSKCISAAERGSFE